MPVHRHSWSDEDATDPLNALLGLQDQPDPDPGRSLALRELSVIQHLEDHRGIGVEPEGLLHGDAAGRFEVPDLRFGGPDIGSGWRLSDSMTTTPFEVLCPTSTRYGAAPFKWQNVAASAWNLKSSMGAWLGASGYPIWDSAGRTLTQIGVGATGGIPRGGDLTVDLGSDYVLQDPAHNLDALWYINPAPPDPRPLHTAHPPTPAPPPAPVPGPSNVPTLVASPPPAPVPGPSNIPTSVARHYIDDETTPLSTVLIESGAVRWEELRLQCSDMLLHQLATVTAFPSDMRKIVKDIVAGYSENLQAEKGPASQRWLEQVNIVIAGKPSRSVLANEEFEELLYHNISTYGRRFYEKIWTACNYYIMPQAAVANPGLIPQAPRFYSSETKAFIKESVDLNIVLPMSILHQLVPSDNIKISKGKKYQ
ncbi:hypothetical protein BV22DRAFT_1052526, partial [Leucogyrophana mollusca]